MTATACPCLGGPVMAGPLLDSRRLRGVKGVIFDCDGVLFDTRDSNTMYYNAIRARMGLGPMSPEQARFCHVHTVFDSIRHISPPGRYEEGLAARKEVDYFTEILPHLRPEPGLFPLLDALRGAGVRLAMHTNRTTTMDRVAEVFGLRIWFNPIMTAAIARPKPHPEGVHRILSFWGLPAREVAFIGDSAVDQATARNAGTAFWVYGGEPLTASLAIPDFWTLRAIWPRRD